MKKAVVGADSRTQHIGVNEEMHTESHGRQWVKRFPFDQLGNEFQSDPNVVGRKGELINDCVLPRSAHLEYLPPSIFTH